MLERIEKWRGECVASHIWRDKTAPDMGHPYILDGRTWVVSDFLEIRCSNESRNGGVSVWLPTSGAMKLRQIWGTQLV